MNRLRRPLALVAVALSGFGAALSARAAGTPPPIGATPNQPRPTPPVIGKPDLVPLGLAFQGLGKAFTWSASVRNAGTAESPATTLAVMLLTAPNGQPNTCYQAQSGWNVPPLKPGELWTLPPPYGSWKDTGWTLEKLKACGGVWSLRADEGNKADESNEANNLLFVPNK